MPLAMRVFEDLFDLGVLAIIVAVCAVLYLAPYWHERTAWGRAAAVPEYRIAMICGALGQPTNCKPDEFVGWGKRFTVRGTYAFNDTVAVVRINKARVLIPVPASFDTEIQKSALENQINWLLLDAAQASTIEPMVDTTSTVAWLYDARVLDQKDLRGVGVDGTVFKATVEVKFARQLYDAQDGGGSGSSAFAWNRLQR